MIQSLQRNKIHFIIFLLVLSFPWVSTGQTNKKLQKHFDKALLNFKSDNFEKAIKETRNVLEQDADFVNAYLLLADIYQEIDSVNQEIEYLDLARLKSNNPAILFRLGEACYSIGKYNKALENYNLYLQSEVISDTRRLSTRRKVESCIFAIDAIKYPVEFHPEKLTENLNSEDNEYWPSISLDQKKLVFTRLIKRTGQMAQEDFYYSEFESENWNYAQPISDINTGQNEGAQILSADGKLMFFTACNRTDGMGSCDIYYSRFSDGKWSVAKNAGKSVNSNSWEAQPGFSSDNRYLYFSSNRAGGKGAKDIWRIEFKGFDDFGNPSWGESENLGENINTKGDEISPFIHPNNKNFYFVSDYHTGMGGFDLFSSIQNLNGSFSRIKNLGFPINSYKNESGLNISSDGKTAFFASERESNSGLDIYNFQLSEELRPDPVTYIQAKVIDAKTSKPVIAHIDLVNLNNQELPVRTEMTDNYGALLFCLPMGTNYVFTVSEEGYLFYSQSFQLSDTKTIQKPYDFTIKLQPVEMGAEMNLYNIYFEIDSFSILKKSEPELQHLVAFFKNNPSLVAEIHGHTDNTGNSEKNQHLSEKRAKSVVEYLVKNGISKSRLNYRGYGQVKPVATNKTVEGRRLNRRTTVKISEQ